ncbi:hypothetical protein [Solobacterium sp.]|uniref:hypothetical protein n=1 Tax=Solobacterium sp. TaxID=2060878 RepID=UPI001CB03727|nr:hypothetical protein [Solobacterium sp.]MBF1085426.1 hypothetical protein [Solobacterium sp.]
MNQMYMIIAVAIIWVVAFAVSITIQMMRKKVEAQLVEKNTTKAIVHFYGNVSEIDGQDVALYHPVKGQMLDTIIALEPGHHTFVGSFQMTENGIVVKHKNYYATDINFAFDVEMSKTYHVGIYKENENNEKVILSLPLAVDGFSSRTLYLIATYE